MDRPPVAHSWEQVAEAIQNAPEEREALSLLEAFLNASPTAQQAQQQQRPTGLDNATTARTAVVDLFGCADTSTWNQLVAQAQRYVELSAQRGRLQPSVDRLEARLVKIKRPLAFLWSCAGDGESSVILVPAAVATLVLSPAFALQWRTESRLHALQKEQQRAFGTLDELGQKLAGAPCSTLLHTAIATNNVRRDREGVIRALLQHGASLELVDSSGCNAHGLSLLASTTAILDAEAERRCSVAAVTRRADTSTTDSTDSTGSSEADAAVAISHDIVQLHAEVVARDTNGDYRKGTVTSVAPDQATCTVLFTPIDGGDTAPPPMRAVHSHPVSHAGVGAKVKENALARPPAILSNCATAHVLTAHQWRAYDNRSDNLLRQALNLRGSLAQVPRYGATPAERRQHFGAFIDEQSHLLPMMSVVGYTTLAERLETGGSLPHSSEMVTVPVTAIPAASKVVFFSHTRLQDRKPDNKHNVKLKGIVEAMQMFAKESGTKVESMYAWIDEACIDQGTWAKYPDIGMAFVYALPLYVAYSDYFVYCRWDRASRQDEALRYENRAWCRVEVVVGWRVGQPPLSSAPRPFERYRLSLFVEGGEDQDDPDGVSVDDLDGVRIVREVTPAGSCPALHPGEGILSVETDRPPLVLIARMLGYEKGHEHVDGTRQVEEPGAGAARRQMRRHSSAFAISEAITSDPASVVDHEARHMRPAELFDEVLKSYFDVSIAAVVVSIPCILFVLILTNSGSILKGGDDHTSGGASLYSLGNHTITNTTLCPEMGGLDSQRGATLDAQKIFALTGGVCLGAWSISTNSLALVSRGFGYQTLRAIKGTLAAMASSWLVMWVGLLVFGNEVVRVGGDVVISVVGASLVIVCQMLFVGRRKVTATVAPATAQNPTFRTLAPPTLIAPAPAEGGNDDTSTQDDPAGKGGDQPKQEGASQALWGIFITLLYAMLYAFVIVPLFMTLSDLHKLTFRLVVHPAVVVTGEMALREVAAAPSDKPAIIKCGAIIGFDIYFQLVGRLLVTAQTDETLAYATVVLIGVQELIIRVSYLPKKRWLRRHLYGLPPLTAEEEGRFLGVLGIDNVSSMQSEMAAIFIATAAKLTMYDVRVNFDLGFEVNEPPDVPFELTAMAVALCVESVGNVVAMAVQRRQGVAHMSMLSGERWRETMLYLASVTLCATAAVFYSFALRNVGFACPSAPFDPHGGAAFCGCDFVRGRAGEHTVLSAFCCLTGK